MAWHSSSCRGGVRLDPARPLQLKCVEAEPASSPLPLFPFWQRFPHRQEESTHLRLECVTVEAGPVSSPLFPSWQRFPHRQEESTHLQLECVTVEAGPAPSPLFPSWQRLPRRQEESTRLRLECVTLCVEAGDPAPSTLFPSWQRFRRHRRSLHRQEESTFDKDLLQPGTPEPFVEAGTPEPLVEAGTQEPFVEAGTQGPPVEAGTQEPLVEAGTPEPLVEAGTQEPLVEAGTPEPLVEAGTQEPLVEAGTQEPLLRLEAVTQGQLVCIEADKNHNHNKQMAVKAADCSSVVGTSSVCELGTSSKTKLPLECVSSSSVSLRLQLECVTVEAGPAPSLLLPSWQRFPHRRHSLHRQDEPTFDGTPSTGRTRTRRHAGAAGDRGGRSGTQEPLAIASTLQAGTPEPLAIEADKNHNKKTAFPSVCETSLGVRDLGVRDLKIIFVLHERTAYVIRASTMYVVRVSNSIRRALKNVLNFFRNFALNTYRFAAAPWYAFSFGTFGFFVGAAGPYALFPIIPVSCGQLPLVLALLGGACGCMGGLLQAFPRHCRVGRMLRDAGARLGGSLGEIWGRVWKRVAAILDSGGQLGVTVWLGGCYGSYIAVVGVYVFWPLLVPITYGSDLLTTIAGVFWGHHRRLIIIIVIKTCRHYGAGSMITVVMSSAVVTTIGMHFVEFLVIREIKSPVINGHELLPRCGPCLVSCYQSVNLFPGAVPVLFPVINP